jgi:hypothetical protein
VLLHQPIDMGQPRDRLPSLLLRRTAARLRAVRLRPATCRPSTELLPAHQPGAAVDHPSVSSRRVSPGRCSAQTARKSARLDPRSHPVASSQAAAGVGPGHHDTPTRLVLTHLARVCAHDGMS